MNYQILKRKSFWLTGCIFLITAAAYAPLDADNGNQTMTVGTFQIDSVAAVGEVVEIPDAQAVIEYDSAVGQYGFHLFAEAQAAWNEITVSDPEGNTIFEGKSSGLLAVTGLMNILIETVEPPIDEQSREEFLARYVAGEYSVRGTTVDGEPAEGTITFTHNIPEPPQIISPAEGAVISRDEVIIAWEPAASTDVEIYALNIFPAPPPEGQEPPALNIDYTVEFPAFITEMRIPAELLAPGIEYQIELAAIEEGGNQTVSIGYFFTVDP